MTLYVLDTDILTLSQTGHPRVSQHICQQFLIYPPNEMAVTVTSVEEQISGWYGQLRQTKLPVDLARVSQHLADCVQNLADWRILSFTLLAIAGLSQKSVFEGSRG